MQIILQTKTQFTERAKTGAKDKDGKDVVAVVNTVIVNPSPKPQVVPDWINKDPMFDLMAKDQTLIQVQVIENAAAQTAPPNPQVAASGWGAAPPNVGIGFQKPE